MNNIQLITKEELIDKLKEIESRGWIRNTRKGNDGAVGNVLEDLLGIPENNLPIPNAAEWELKARRANTSALLTLCHMEPSPRAVQIVDKFCCHIMVGNIRKRANVIRNRKCLLERL